MERGELVPDDVTEAMVAERLARPDAQGGFILDGFPRTVSQAAALTKMLADQRRRLTGVLFVDVSDEAIVPSLKGASPSPPAARPDIAATRWAISHPLRSALCLPHPPRHPLRHGCPSWDPQPTLLSSPTGPLDALSLDGYPPYAMLAGRPCAIHRLSKQLRRQVDPSQVFRREGRLRGDP